MSPVAGLILRVREGVPRVGGDEPAQLHVNVQSTLCSPRWRG